MTRACLRRGWRRVGKDDAFTDVGRDGQLAAPLERHSVEVRGMTWEAPDFVEVKMDAEIRAYQEDPDQEREDQF